MCPKERVATPLLAAGLETLQFDAQAHAAVRRLRRHVDNLPPFTNLEIVGIAGPDWTGKLRLGVGLRTNF